MGRPTNPNSLFSRILRTVREKGGDLTLPEICSHTGIKTKACSRVLHYFVETKKFLKRKGKRRYYVYSVDERFSQEIKEYLGEA